MERFAFTAEEIDTHRSTHQEWHCFVRRREAEMIFSLFPNVRFPLALELGAGSGDQSITLQKYCERLVCTEKDQNSPAGFGTNILERHLPNVEYRLLDAEDLTCFDDNSFDLVFSSNMLEHVHNIDRCLQECRRVLKGRGFMLHTMPSRWWKTAYLFCSLLRCRRPPIHGISTNHWREWRAFGQETWENRFEANGLQVERTVGLPFYVGHGNSFIPIIKLGNAAGISATYLYVVKKE